MKNLTKSFKVFFIAFLALFLVGVIVTCIFGINAFGSLGKGQQLILNVTAGKDSYDEDIAEVKDYLKEHPEISEEEAINNEEIFAELDRILKEKDEWIRFASIIELHSPIIL